MNERDFLNTALEIFHFQAQHNAVYKRYLNLLGVDHTAVIKLEEIPFLPIELFKTEIILSPNKESPEGTVKNSIIFTSSGTTGTEISRHHVLDVNVYEESFRRSFELFYGNIEEYCILALLPSYLEREGSSLVYMMDKMIKQSGHADSGFYLHDHEKLFNTLNRLQEQKQKTLLLGVSYALLDFVSEFPVEFPELLVMETGGMKGRRKELLREELHTILKKGFGVSAIHSEYGMTELLSQAYSQGAGIFRTPPWMKIIVRQISDPLTLCPVGETGLISVIDLANIYSCSFITTSDLGKLHHDGSFEILGRSDYSDIRGCNLMIE